MIVHVRLDMDDDMMHGFKQVTGQHPTRKAVVAETQRVMHDWCVGSEASPKKKKKKKKQKFTLRRS